MKKNPIFSLLLIISLVCLGCQRDSLQEETVQQDNLKLELKEFKKSLSNFDLITYNSTDKKEGDKEAEFILNASKRLLLAGGISKEKLEKLEKGNKNDILSRAMMFYYNETRLKNINLTL